MSNLKSAYLENAYELLSPLQDGKDCSTFLVKEKSTGTLAVKKQLTLEQYELYQILKEYSHPNLSRIFETYMLDGHYYALTEYVSGKTIAQTIQQGSLFSREGTLSYILQLCNVLSFLHKKGIIHRDITPGNIVISTDHIVKLIDFGIARFKKPNQSQDTVLLGTAGFAPPEQFGFGQTDERSDIYSLGVLLNYMLTGKLPAEQISSDTSFSGIILRCTQIDPKNRFSSIEELQSALRHCQIKYPVCTSAAKTYRPFRRLLTLLPGFHKKKPLHILCSILGYLLLIILTVSSLDLTLPFGSETASYWMILIFLFYVPFGIFGNIGNYESHIKNFSNWPAIYRILLKCALFLFSFSILFLYVLVWEVIL